MTIICMLMMTMTMTMMTTTKLTAMMTGTMTDVGNMQMIRAIQVLRIHLLELEKVR